MLIYSVGTLATIDHRLDELEKEARVLLEGDGSVRPSPEAVKASIMVEALEKRVDKLEGKTR